MWTGLFWLGIGAGGELNTMLGNCRVATQLVATHCSSAIQAFRRLLAADKPVHVCYIVIHLAADNVQAGWGSCLLYRSGGLMSSCCYGVEPRCWGGGGHTD
jgi:hypothetical protein